MKKLVTIFYTVIAITAFQLSAREVQTIEELENVLVQNETMLCPNCAQGSSRPVDCAECCAKGLGMSPECAAQCNKCDVFGTDNSIQEAQDFPN